MKTSTTHYVTLKTMSHYKEPAVPIRTAEGRCLVYAFMSRNPERYIWISKEDLSPATPSNPTGNTV